MKKTYTEPSGYFTKEMKKILEAGEKKTKTTKPAPKKTTTTKK